MFASKLIIDHSVMVLMKNIEVKEIIEPLPAFDGAGVKLKRSIGTPAINYLDPFFNVR